MSRLTLSQAQAIVAENTPAVLASGKWDPRLIGWSATSDMTEQAVLVAQLACKMAFESAEQSASWRIYRALLAYQSHLDHEAGRAFELAAVRRAAQSGVGADDAMDGDAFLRFDEALANGYHHAEPKEA